MRVIALDMQALICVHHSLGSHRYAQGRQANMVRALLGYRHHVSGRKRSRGCREDGARTTLPCEPDPLPLMSNLSNLTIVACKRPRHTCRQRDRPPSLACSWLHQSPHHARHANSDPPLVPLFGPKIAIDNRCASRLQIKTRGRERVPS